MFLVFGLFMAGVGYAHWSDEVYIEGQVEMGSLTIAFDPDEPLVPVEVPEHLGKDVGSADQYYDETSLVTDEHTGKSGYKTMIIEIHNAYPCYEVHFPSIKILNIGTIPAHFVEIVVTGHDVTDDEPLTFEWKEGFQYEKGDFKDDVDGDGVLENIINVEIVNFVCNQLDPCHDTKGEVDFHFKQDVEECHTYTFEITIVAVQWNKA